MTLNWNNTDVTCEVLESTRQLTWKNYEILVCGMNSDIDPTERINSKNYPNTKVIRSKKNLGWGPGNNWGMRQAKGDFLFIVNNDTEITPRLIEALIEPFSRDETIGITCPKIRYFYNPEVIQYAGFNPINNLTGRNTSVGNCEIDKGQHDVSGFTFSGHGCAMMMKKEVMEKVVKNREKQLDRALLNSDHIIGSIEGIAGKDSIDIDKLDYDAENLLENE